MSDAKWTTIRISRDVHNELYKRASKGESYNRVIARLIADNELARLIEREKPNAGV